MSPDQLKWAIEDEKYKMKTKNQEVSKVGDNILIRKENGDIETVNITKALEAPKLTGNQELDLKKVSKYKGELTSRATDILKLNEAGQMTDTEAEAKLLELKKLKDSVAAPKKARTIKLKLPKIAKVRTISIKAPKKAKMKLPKLKIKSIKISKPKKIKISK